MKGDITRDTFDRTKHYSGVWMQQGRVHLDADWNEQSSISLHLLRTLTRDLLGEYAGPAGSNGFRVINPNDVSAEDQDRLGEMGLWPLQTGDFLLGAGHYYVGGILCENEYPTTYLCQPDLVGSAALDKDKIHFVYLDVWERHITALEDDSIREKALNGPDTATRAKVVWQVCVTHAGVDGKPLPANLTCVGMGGYWGKWLEAWQPSNRGYLKAHVAQTERNTDPCIETPASRFRGKSNRLFRVEIHASGAAKKTGGATFKWSRDNGSVATRLVGVEGDGLTVVSSRGFAPNDWVEVTDDERELRRDPGALIRLSKVEADTLTVDPKSRTDTLDLGHMTKVRRWDQKGTGSVALTGGVVPVVEGKWLPLEDGVEIWFDKGAATYRAGDYWLIPARWATGDIEWPRKKPAAQADKPQELEPLARPPHGVTHHFAPLAIVTVGPEGDVTKAEDCRCHFAVPNDCIAYPYGVASAGDVDF